MNWKKKKIYPALRHSKLSDIQGLKESINQDKPPHGLSRSLNFTQMESTFINISKAKVTIHQFLEDKSKIKRKQGFSS